jgi:two-component system, NarL family, nitrate/nitrite response regulator NarL
MTRILIADDNDAVRQMIRSLVESREDFQVCGEAADGMEAIDKAKQLKPDLVILDITMPRVDGFEAARVIRKFFPDIRILIFSVHKANQLMKELLETGVNGAIDKSESHMLLQAIDTVLRDGRYFAAAAGYA